MKKLLKPLFTALFAGMVCTGAKAAEPQVINIRTNDLSMVMSVAPNGEVLFHHFGGRIDDASPAAGIKRVTTEPRTWPIPRREAATSANPRCA